MWKQNDNIKDSSVLQNQFTAYLVTAVRRKKFRYQQNKYNRQCNELSLEQNEYLSELQTEPDMLDILSPLERIDNYRLQQALEQQKESDLYIFLTKVLGEHSFVEIAEELGMEYKAVTAVYYRLITKLKNELRGDDE